MDEYYELRNGTGKLEITYYGGDTILISGTDYVGRGGGNFTIREARLFAHKLTQYANEAERRTKDD